MRRIAILGAVVGAAVLVLWARGARLHERVMAHCGAMFEHMPDTYPPKKMMRGIEEICDKTDQILAVLEAKENSVTPAVLAAGPDEGVQHAA